MGGAEGKGTATVEGAAGAVGATSAGAEASVGAVGAISVDTTDGTDAVGVQLSTPSGETVVMPAGAMGAAGAILAKSGDAGET